jgi:hypothetical protein
LAAAVCSATHTLTRYRASMDAILDWLADNWVPTVVGAVLSLMVGALVSGAIALMQRQPTRLDYYVVTKAGVLKRGARKVEGLIDLNVAGETVERPFIAHLRILNTGKTTLRSDHFLTPVTIYSRTARPLAAMVTGSYRSEVAEDAASVHEGNVTLLPTWIDTRGFINVAVIFNADPRELRVVCNLADNGGKQMRELLRGGDEGSPMFRRAYWLFRAVLIFWASGVVFTVASIDPPAAAAFTTGLVIWALYRLETRDDLYL